MSADRHYYDTHRTARLSNQSANRIDRSDQMARNIPRLIAALERDIEIIEQSIAAEEVATRQSDRTRMDYSLVARSLIARRDNLVATKLALNSRLGTSVDETRHAGFSTVVETQAYA